MKMKLTWLLMGVAALVLYAGTTETALARDAKVPEECLEPNLSEELQRFCDQLQFADVPHYHVVRLAGSGAVRSIHLIETETGREVFTSYPHGIKFATPDQDDNELRTRPEELEKVLKGLPTPAENGEAVTRGTSEDFARGLPIGWNSSTGPTPGQCLNYTIATLSNPAEMTNFTSQNAASSTAEQINVSATVNVAFDFFQASNTFSFSDQWQSSTNSENQYYNVYSLYTLNTTVSQSDPLTEQGEGADTSFNTLCGSEYLSSVPVGMVATLNLNYGSTSSSTLMSISDTLSLNFGLDNVSTAVQTASEDTNSSSYFTFSFIHYGGGTAASAALAAPFKATNSAGEAFYALCAQGNAEACTQFTSRLGDAAITALDSFDQQVAGLSGAASPDLSFLQIFPHGVAGVNTSQSVTTPIPLPSNNEVLAPYKPQLEEVVTLVNQISTLRNRVRLLEGLFNAEPSLNPAEVLDIVSYLNRLDDIYTADRNTLIKNLGNCLKATSDNVTTICQPIIANQATNAFEYYAADGPGSDFFAQQNTLALQYTALSQVEMSITIPQDVIYIDELPSFAAAGNPPIAGEAAFVNFVDRPLSAEGSGTFLDPSFDILALEPNEPLSTNNVSTTVRNNPPAPSPFTFWSFAVFDSGGVSIASEDIPGSTFSSAQCTPTFANPCAINYFIPPNAGGLTETVQHRQIEELFTAD
jgi:hypothetical protein